jgi:hypothetical protein
MHSFCLKTLLLTAFLVTALAAPAAMAAKKKAADAPQDTTTLPWELRPFFSFTQDNSKLDYAEDNAEWRMNVDGHGEILSSAGFSVVLGDGTTLSRANLKRVSSLRSQKEESGRGSENYSVTFAPSSGLEVVHQLVGLKGMPGYLVRIAVRNVSDQPVALQKISPVVIPAGGMKGLPADTVVSLRRPLSRAGFMYTDGAEDTTLAMFRPQDNSFRLVLGMLSTGASEASLALAEGDKGWTGELSSAYVPALMLRPGEAIESESAWVSASIESVADAMRYFAFVYSTLPRATQAWNLPRLWAAPAAGASFTDSVRYAGAMKGMGVTHILLPLGWEESPGAMKGNGKHFPGKMADTAKALSAMEMQPGLAVDPLAVNGAASPGAIFAADGGAWANPFHAEGKALIEQRLATVKQWGFDFAVCATSAIPDAALNEFGITRSQAEREALAIACAAANAPRMAPPALSATEFSLDGILGGMGELGAFVDMAMMPTPLRLNVEGAGKIDGDLLTALQMWPGAFQLDGTPDGSARGGIASLVASRSLQASPVDGDQTAPRLWRIRLDNSRIGLQTNAIAAFPGAPAWTVDSLALTGEVPVTAWRIADGQLLGGGATSIPAANGLTYYGLTAMNGHPTFMGTSNAPLLDLDRITRMAWDPEKLTLSCDMDGTLASGTTAYVYVPDGFVCAEGKVGNRKADLKTEGGRVAFALDTTSPKFELRFTRP